VIAVPTYCTHCQAPCATTEAVVGCRDRWDDRRELHYTEDLVAEVSACCEAEVTRDDPREEDETDADPDPDLPRPDPGV
jgi:hypothetical protein